MEETPVFDLRISTLQLPFEALVLFNPILLTGVNRDEFVPTLVQFC